MQQQLADAGLAGLASAAAPSLCPDVCTLRHAWRWCSGWVPERLPLYLALHPFDDPLLLIELLQYLQDRLAAKDIDA